MRSSYAAYPIQERRVTGRILFKNEMAMRSSYEAYPIQE
jgi:hypothetical protein